MTRKTKINIVLVTAGALLLYWALLAFTHTKYQMINYWWQAFMAAAAILYGILGISTAKHWGGLKSSVGKSVLFISLGVIMWGVGQAGWTYFVIKDPAQQSPPSDLVSILYFTSIPLWAYGIFKLSKASGARYGLRSLKAKVAVLLMTVLTLVISYIVLVNVARGGTAYFHQTFDVIFFDLGYAAGDAINLILALAIYGLSWKLLGGRFKIPISVILLGFALIYMADFWFSFRDGKGLYYNGDWTDLLYLMMAATFGLGLCMLDPTGKKVAAATPEASPQPVNPPDDSIPEAAVPAMPPVTAEPIQTPATPTQTVEAPPIEPAAPVPEVPVPASTPPAETDGAPIDTNQTPVSGGQN